MAAVASPSPVPVQHAYVDPRRLPIRAPSRSMMPRPYGSRPSPYKSVVNRSLPQAATNDSSDDEDLAPIKLSAEAQAILGENDSNLGADRENRPLYESSLYQTIRKEAEAQGHILYDKSVSPKHSDGSPAPRVMRVISGNRRSPPAVLARDGSFAYKIHDKSKLAEGSALESKTPATRLRRIRVSGSRSQTKSPVSVSDREQIDGHKSADYMSPDESIQKSSPDDDQALAGPSTIMRPKRMDENGIYSTMRVRRIGAGTLLNGPIRRGMIRRHSEEEEIQVAHQVEEVPSPEIEHGRRAEPELKDDPDDFLSVYSPPRQAKPIDVKPSPIADLHHSPISEDRKLAYPQPQRHILSTSINRSNPTPATDRSHPSQKSSSSIRKPIFKIPALPPLEAVHDQENEPPPTFKRSKQSAPMLEIHEDERDKEEAKPQLQQQLELPSIHSPSRQPLAARNNNTPHRAAPAPPPKMSLIEAATSSAGNSRAKKSVHYILNGRTYRRLDCIGRGGSSRVFRIMAENYKIFALKRVNLEEADMAAIAGYKGEIDLLKKLENVDRVVRLFDYEVNEDKGVLNVLMELGESDFNKMLNDQLKTENAKLDITFTRYYWKEMLACVQAVHDHDIVHSDLKPANFLLVKGQLKLIDFGIANAIQVEDNTVNVHRENQIGTPNYMSPESLVCQTPAVGQAAGTKLIKLGKPSDVWSLGCILYQMTYGQPPFAHITKQFERIMSIPNPKVEIQFPTTGIGGAVVPFGLIKTLRRCLERDQVLRPTISDLLSDSDPFLNPVAISPEMLGRVIGNVVGYCRKREESLKQQGQLRVSDGVSCLPRDDIMREWPALFYDKLRQAQEEGTAW